MRKQEIINCPKCGQEFEKYNKWGDERKFCSRSCANSHIHTKKSKNKISKSLKKYFKENQHVSLKDNMSVEDIRRAAIIRDRMQGRGHDVLLEASGNINLHNIASYAATGVDIISLGTLTKDIHSFDFSLEVR